MAKYCSAEEMEGNGLFVKMAGSSLVNNRGLIDAAIRMASINQIGNINMSVPCGWSRAAILSSGHASRCLSFIVLEESHIQPLLPD